MKDLNGDMIFPKFGEDQYYHEAGSKPELILFWVHDIVTIYKKESLMLIDSSYIDMNEINSIDVVIDGDHGQ